MTFHAKDYTPPSGEQIREARKNANFTQEAIADAVGVSRRSWIRYEDGSANMPRPVFLAFCQACNLDPQKTFPPNM